MSPVPASPPVSRPARADSDWLGLTDASAFLGVSAATLRRWSDAGQVPVFTTPGGHRRFSRRALAALIPSDRRETPQLSRMGASPERIARAYHARPPGRRRDDDAWLARLTDAETATFRSRGRTLVTHLLRHLDEGPDGAGEHLDRALGLAAEHGRAMAQRGCTTAQAVQTFLRFRSPFMGELARLAVARGLDTREATSLMSSVEATLDQLLIATIDGHAASRPAAGGVEAPTREARGRKDRAGQTTVST